MLTMHEKPVNETKMSRLIGASSDSFSSSKLVKFSQYVSILFCLSSPPFIIANSMSQSKVSGQWFMSGGNQIFPLTLALNTGWQNVGLKKNGIVTCPADDESMCVVVVLFTVYCMSAFTDFCVGPAWWPFLHRVCPWFHSPPPYLG